MSTILAMTAVREKPLVHPRQRAELGVSPMWAHRAFVCTLIALLPCAVTGGTPPIGAADSNLVPNALLLDSGGFVGGAVTGSAPTLWRAATVGGGALTLESIPLPANTLFAGSPPTTGIKISVTAFGTDQVFDHTQAMFSFRPGRSYNARIYVRSGNADNSAQGFTVSMPIFDSALSFTGRDPAAFSDTVSNAWTAFTSPDAVGVAGDAYAHLAVRLQNDGGENSIIVALPTVLGPPVTNAVPNPGFAGNAGASTGTVTGTVPDNWRAFAVATGSINLAVEPLAGNALFPGSPPTNAVRLGVIGGNGSAEGFDHQLSRPVLRSEHQYWGEVFVRSGNANGSIQGLTISLPVFDAAGNFTGNQPGSIAVSVGPQWRLIAGPAFSATAGQTTNLAFRLTADGGEDSVLVAAPRIVSPAELLFANGFE